MKPPAPGDLASPLGEEKRRKLESPSPEFPEPPAPVDLDTPRKKKKKKKRRREREASLAAGDDGGDLHSPPPPLNGQTTSPKIKKEMSREEESPRNATVEVFFFLKKTEGERGGGEEEEETVSDPAVTGKKKKKKKKRVRREEEQRSADIPISTATGVETTDLVPVETTETRMERREEGRKKKKDKSVVEVTTTHNTTDSQEVETVNEKKNTKKNIKKNIKENGMRGGEEGRSRSKRKVQETDGGGEVTVKKRKKSNFVEGLMNQVELSAELLELEEFIPNIRSKSLNEQKKLVRYDLKRFRVFKREGISLRNGRYSAEENQRIRANVADFLALTGISSATRLFFPQLFNEQEAEIKKLRVQHQFLERIAEGIPRSCQQVNIRAKKMFDVLNHLGRFSENEINSLVKLQTLHGNNWSIIGQKMDRSKYALEKRFSHIANSHGPWNTAEVSRLNQALKAHMEVLVQQGSSGSWLSRDQLCNNLPWKKISEQVQTRSWSQCRVKWLSILRYKMAAGQRPDFRRRPEALQFKILLINRVYSLNVEDAADIDWDEVANAFSNLTPHYLQRSFHRLKVSRVPNWSCLPFCEIIDLLQSTVVPQLKDQLEEIGLSGHSEEVQQEAQDRYSLSDIFSQDEEFEEVDNTQQGITVTYSKSF